FGTTGRCAPFEEDLIEAIEDHAFDPLTFAWWRNSALDFSSLAKLESSLARSSTGIDLIRTGKAEDEVTLEIASARPGIRSLASTREGVRRLWDLCQLPDYRKVSPNIHADLVVSLYEPIMRKGAIDADWFAREIQSCDRLDGDLDALAWRLAYMRTWSYCANRPDWLRDPVHWQNATRALEDRLSDALHEKLMQRFVDRRTSVLMRRLKENTLMDAEVTPTGDVIVEGQNIGRLAGFRFTPDPNAEGNEAKALRATASKALGSEIEARAARLSTAGDEQFALSLDGIIRFIGEPIAALQAGAKVLEPRFVLLADEELAGIHREMVETRLGIWLKAHIAKHLGPLFGLESGEGSTGIARGIAFRLAENLGVLDRQIVSGDVRGLDQNARGELRKLGVRFGAHHLFLPALMKPGPRSLAAQLHVLATGGDDVGLKDVSHLAYSGRTSIPLDPAIKPELYRIAGYRVAGPRALRIDILERLADLIRPAIAYRPGITVGEPPAGAADGDAFVVTGAMTSLVGAAGQDFAEVLKALGYRSETRPGPAITQEIKRAAPMIPIAPMEMVVAEADAVESTDATGETVEQAAEAEPVLADLVEPETVIEISAPEPEALSDSVTETLVEVVTVEAVPAEVVTTEIWRVARAERPQNRDRRPQRGEPRKEGEGGRPPWRKGPRPGQNAQAPTSAPQTSLPVEGVAPPPAGDAPRRHEDQRRDKREKFEKFGGKREDRPEGRGPGGGKPWQKREGGRPDRGDRERGPEHRVFATSTGNDKRKGGDKAPDPDSPFAKLAALKAQLEGKN
ncbi:MAG: helicase-related protein, partial [Rhabdaerophilum sp.]